MSKVAVVYWSGTGNTEAMAKAVVEGAEGAGAEVSLFFASEFTPDKLDQYDGLALGCPAMGDEELEPDEFQPMFDSIKGDLKDRRLVLFGSYSWAEGAWMETWQDEVKGLGAKLLEDGLIAYDAPDEDALAACRALGAKLA